MHRPFFAQLRPDARNTLLSGRILDAAGQRNPAELVDAFGQWRALRTNVPPTIVVQGLSGEEIRLRAEATPPQIEAIRQELPRAIRRLLRQQGAEVPPPKGRGA